MWVAMVHVKHISYLAHLTKLGCCIGSYIVLPCPIACLPRLLKINVKFIQWRTIDATNINVSGMFLHNNIGILSMVHRSEEMREYLVQGTVFGLHLMLDLP